MTKKTLASIAAVLKVSCLHVHFLCTCKVTPFLVEQYASHGHSWRFLLKLMSVLGRSWVHLLKEEVGAGSTAAVSLCRRYQTALSPQPGIHLSLHTFVIIGQELQNLVTNILNPDLGSSSRESRC